MAFDTPAGTRGARQPRAGMMMRWVNKSAAGRVRRSGRVMGFNALILTTTGARTGTERTNPVAWFPGSDGTWLIVASAGGAARNPDWYHNIAAHPNKVAIEVDGRTVPVTAQQLHGDDRERAWQQITATVSRFGQYQGKTDRELPVIRLAPRSGPEG